MFADNKNLMKEFNMDQEVLKSFYYDIVICHYMNEMLLKMRVLVLCVLIWYTKILCREGYE